MDNKPTLDRAILIPLILGVFAVFGICLVVLLSQLDVSRSFSGEEAETPTPFKFIFLGTEPGITTLTPDENAPPAPTATEVAFELLIPSPTEEFLNGDETESPTKPSDVLTNPASSKPTTSPSNAPLNPGTYDQFDAHIAYEGNWVEQVDVPDVYENTLTVSATVGDSLTFRFIGEQVRIFFQEGPGFGTVRITMDGLEFDLDQSASVTDIAEWVSPLLINATHTVEIVHLSGGSVNLDSVIVPDPLSTATPTGTQ
jgi:hypothetical protein